MKRFFVRNAVRPILIGVGSIVVSHCLQRPVAEQQPTTKANFTATVKQQAVDKIDILFMIDNSVSMGDKQNILKEAVPDLIDRLVSPNCVDRADPDRVLGKVDPQGKCGTNARPEFPPVRNLHIGVVTSSLGPRLGTACTPLEIGKRNDDKGELINRSGTAGTPIAKIQPSNFLAWFPSVPENNGKDPGKGATPYTDLTAFNNDFKGLIVGVGQSGCGIESQLESWYRFLVQPDPYASLEESDDTATWKDVDKTILQQRKDFLRPDSLVAVIALTDEDDSEIDVRAFRGAYFFNRQNFSPPRGTKICETEPTSENCQSCEFTNAPNDENCKLGKYTVPNDWGGNLNLRHVQMKRKYGVDPRFPIKRYVDGLISPTVQNRDGQDCTNPLFASVLPDGSDLSPETLCKLPRSTRQADLIFYTIIGGVPPDLVKPHMSKEDWVKVVGANPDKYDTTGLDPRMIESTEPRKEAISAKLSRPETTTAADDPNNPTLREWITKRSNSVDLQYACIFKLPAATDCTTTEGLASCDCAPNPGFVETSTPPEQRPPLCDPANPSTRQVAAKAYPTPRMLDLARRLGSQGITASICPTNSTDPTRPDYGYRPAVAAIVDRLKNALASQCLPQPLAADAEGKVPCLVIETVPSSVGTVCDPNEGRDELDSVVKSEFVKSLVARAKEIAPNDSFDPSSVRVCQLAQLAGADLFDGSCENSSKSGWCYVTGRAAGGQCTQAIKFSPGGNPTLPSQGFGSFTSLLGTSLQCINQSGEQDIGNTAEGGSPP